MSPDVETLVASALTPRGACELTLDQVISVIHAARASGHPYSCVDPWEINQGYAGEFGFRIDIPAMSEEGKSRDQIVEETTRWALVVFDSYRATIRPQVRFDLWLWRGAL